MRVYIWEEAGGGPGRVRSAFDVAQFEPSRLTASAMIIEYADSRRWRRDALVVASSEGT